MKTIDSYKANKVPVMWKGKNLREYERERNRDVKRVSIEKEISVHREKLKMLTNKLMQLENKRVHGASLLTKRMNIISTLEQKLYHTEQILSLERKKNRNG